MVPFSKARIAPTSHQFTDIHIRRMSTRDFFLDGLRFAKEHWDVITGELYAGIEVNFVTKLAFGSKF